MLSKFKTTELFAHQFVISAGSVLFKISDTEDLSICILHHPVRGEWWLPKGRKDRGETIQDAAMRETFEETGFRCTLFPVNLETRATIPGVDYEDAPHFEEQSSEPIAVTVRHYSEEDMKIIWWFASQVEEDALEQQGVRRAGESFKAAFYNAEEAIEKLTFLADKKIARRALELVRATRSQQQA